MNVWQGIADLITDFLTTGWSKSVVAAWLATLFAALVYWQTWRLRVPKVQISLYPIWDEPYRGDMRVVISGIRGNVEVVGIRFVGPVQLKRIKPVFLAEPIADPVKQAPGREISLYNPLFVEEGKTTIVSFRITPGNDAAHLRRFNPYVTFQIQAKCQAANGRIAKSNKTLLIIDEHDSYVHFGKQWNQIDRYTSRRLRKYDIHDGAVG